MSRRQSKGIWRVALLLIGVAVLGWLDFRRPAEIGRPPAAAYETHVGCRWVDHRRNDGDSFRARLPDGRVEEFRLYFVDAPESAFRTYAGGRTNRERIADQAADLGISSQQAVEIGGRAKSLVRGRLSNDPFTLHTRWDDPFGDRRYHAFVTPSTGPWLHETLVREGLARIHTKPAGLPDGTPAESRLQHLREIETEAKRARRGGWAGSVLLYDNQ